MALLPDRERAFALARSAGVWKTFADGSWLTDGGFAVRVAVPFETPHALRLFCSCPREVLETIHPDGLSGPGEHYFDLERPCVYVKMWEPDTAAGEALEALASGRIIQTDPEIPITFGEPYMATPTRLVRATFGPGPKDWFSIRQSIMQVIQQEGNPDRWLKARINGHQCSDHDHEHAPNVYKEGLVAMNGSLLVGVMMPVVAEGSALDRAAYQRDEEKVAAAVQSSFLASIPEEIRRAMPPDLLRTLMMMAGLGDEVTVTVLPFGGAAPSDTPSPDPEPETSTGPDVMSWLRDQFGDEPEDAPRD